MSSSGRTVRSHRQATRAPHHTATTDDPAMGQDTTHHASRWDTGLLRSGLAITHAHLVGVEHVGASFQQEPDGVRLIEEHGRMQRRASPLRHQHAR